MKTDERERSATEAAGYIVGAGLGMASRVARGNPISAAIIVLAAAILLVGGSYIAHSDTRLFVQVVGCIVGVIGLTGWFFSVGERAHRGRP